MDHPDPQRNDESEQPVFTTESKNCHFPENVGAALLGEDPDFVDDQEQGNDKGGQNDQQAAEVDDNTANIAKNHIRHVSPPPSRPAQTPRFKLRANAVVPTPEEVAPLASSFVKGKSISGEKNTPEALAVVVRSLEDQRDDLIYSGEIEKSMRVQTAVENARVQQLTSLKKCFQDDRIQTVKTREEDTKAGFSDFNVQIDTESQDLEIKLKKFEEELGQRQQEELQAHDQDWQSEYKQRLYNRSSQKLRILRLQQGLLLNARRFMEAKQVAGIADGIQSKEVAENHRRMMLDYRQSLYLLQSKHEQEKAVFNQFANEQRGYLNRRKECLERPFENRFKVLQTEEENAQDRERLWNRIKRTVDVDPIVYVVGEKERKPKVITREKTDSGVLPLPPLPVQSARRRKPDPLANTH